MTGEWPDTVPGRRHPEKREEEFCLIAVKHEGRWT